MMRRFQLITVVALVVASAAAAQTTAPKPQSAADYLRGYAAASSSSSSSSSGSSSSTGMLIYTSCKAFRDQGGITASMSRDDVTDAARAAGCTDAEINSLTALWDVLPHS